MNKEEYVRLMRILFKNYGKEFDKEQVTVWYGYLKSYETLKLENAINKICLKNKFLPSLSDIVEIIENENGSSEDMFEKIKLCIQKYPYNMNQCSDSYQIDGMYEILGDVGFDIINKIGYENLCSMNDYNRKEYKERIEYLLKENKGNKEQLKLIENERKMLNE